MADFLEKRVSAAGHHDGIHDELDSSIREDIRHGLDDGCGKEHSGLDGGHRKGRQTQGNLLGHHLRSHGLNRGHLAGHFGHHAGDGRKSVTAKPGDRLEIGLRASAPALLSEPAIVSTTGLRRSAVIAVRSNDPPTVQTRPDLAGKPLFLTSISPSMFSDRDCRKRPAGSRSACQGTRRRPPRR